MNVEVITTVGVIGGVVGAVLLVNLGNWDAASWAATSAVWALLAWIEQRKRKVP